jgi:arylsulfatase A-like enzyme
MTVMLLADIVPTLVDMLAFPLPSKDTEPATAPVNEIVLAVDKLTSTCY